MLTNRLKEAEATLRREIVIWEQSLEPDHPTVATGLNGLGHVLFRDGRLSEAIPPLQRAVEILLANTADRRAPHINLQTMTQNYADALSELGLSRREIDTNLRELFERFGLDVKFGDTTENRD
jgi:hypothetical protein